MLAAAAGLDAEVVDEKNFNQALAGQRIALPSRKTPPPSPTDRPPRPAGSEQLDMDGASHAETEPPQPTDRPPQPRYFEFTKQQRDQLATLQKAVEDYHQAARFQSSVDTLTAPEKLEDVPPTHVLMNGDAFAKGEAVQPGCLSAVPNWSEDLQSDIDACGKSSRGRRHVLAQWLADAANPLTPRVYVNRVWQFHFGAGIVATSNDFGLNGAGPSHPELLDYLTRWFLDHGWRTKPLHRLIVLSRTYRAASEHAQWDQCAAVDPDNRLLWRAPLRRLQAESIRDALLVVSGRLNTSVGGPGFFELLPEGMGADYPFFSWRPSPQDQRRRRSLYMFQRRNLVHPLMEAFDVADMSQSCERRGHAVTAPQSLALMNGKLVEEASRRLADDLAASLTNDRERVRRLFLLTCARQPTDRDVADCGEFLAAKRREYYRAAATAAKGKDAAVADSEDDHPPSPEVLALRDLCRVAFSCNEFLYVD